MVTYRNRHRVDFLKIRFRGIFVARFATSSFVALRTQSRLSQTPFSLDLRRSLRDFVVCRSTDTVDSTKVRFVGSSSLTSRLRYFVVRRIRRRLEASQNCLITLETFYGNFLVKICHHNCGKMTANVQDHANATTVVFQMINRKFSNKENF